MSRLPDQQARLAFRLRRRSACFFGTGDLVIGRSSTPEQQPGTQGDFIVSATLRSTQQGHSTRIQLDNATAVAALRKLSRRHKKLHSSKSSEPHCNCEHAVHIPKVENWHAVRVRLQGDALIAWRCFKTCATGQQALKC